MNLWFGIILVFYYDFCVFIKEGFLFGFGFLFRVFFKMLIDSLINSCCYFWCDNGRYREVRVRFLMFGLLL